MRRPDPAAGLRFAAVSLILCTANICAVARRASYALLLDDEEDGGGGGDGSASFSFFPQTQPRGLVYGFYDESCPDAEGIVSSTVRELYLANPNVAAALVRLFFHDCFIHVRVLRASRLIHSHGVLSTLARLTQPRCSLPRDARAGLRRLGAPGPHQRRQVGEGSGPEPVAERLRRRRQDQGEAGGGVPADRLLRRHPGPRRAGQPRPSGRAELSRAHRTQRQRQGLLRRGGRAHPVAERHLHRDARCVRPPRLHRARDRRALRSVPFVPPSVHWRSRACICI